MSCDQVEPALIGYHFGTLADDERAAIEAHLPGCPACVKAFVDAKRSIESGEDGPRPSPALRARLRQSVAVELGLAERPRRRWESPLAFAFAASAVFASVLAMHTLTH